MISGQFTSWRDISLFQSHELWAKIFIWLEQNLDILEIGEYTLPFGDCLVRVMEYNLKSRESAIYEAHKYTIDLQMSLKGGEGIEWTPIDQLKKKGNYKVKSDFQFYMTPKEYGGFVYNRAGMFTILFPEDGHQPQRLIGTNKTVKKNKFFVRSI